MKIKTQLLRTAFAATYRNPEWFSISDYPAIELQEYIHQSLAEDESLGRLPLSASVKIASYGEFLDGKGNQVDVVAIIYQYSMKKDPVNIHFSYKIFLNGKVHNHNSGLGSIHEAESCVIQEAKELINHLLDINKMEDFLISAT